MKISKQEKRNRLSEHHIRRTLELQIVNLQADLIEAQGTIGNLAEELTESEIRATRLERQVDHFSHVLHFGADLETATRELDQANAIRLGVLPRADFISEKVDSQNVEIHTHPLILSIAKDLGNLQRFSDCITHLAFLIREELNKTDQKTRIKVRDTQKVKAIQELRDAPRPKPGKQKRTAEEKIALNFINGMGINNADALFSLLKPCLPHFSDVQIAVLADKLIKE